MIDAAQRMQEARDQARTLMARMGECDGGDKGKRNGGNAKRGTMHGSLRVVRCLGYRLLVRSLGYDV